MFKGSYQKKLLTILYSGGSNPLDVWDIQVKNGWTRRVKDEDLGSIVFEIAGTNVATAYIVSPPEPRGVLGISLPFITMFIKNLKRYFTFEIQILDDKKMRRRFRFSNYQSTTKVRPFACSVPLALKPGWNQMQLNLANFTMRAYGTNYMETQRVQIHANCRIRRVYFSDKLYTEEELPRDYRIYLNVRQSQQPKPSPAEQPRPSMEKHDENMEKQHEKTSSILKRSVDAFADAKADIESADDFFKDESLTKTPEAEPVVEEPSDEEPPQELQKKAKSVVSIKSKLSKAPSKSTLAEHQLASSLHKKSTVSVKSKTSRVRTKSTLTKKPTEDIDLARTSRSSLRSFLRMPSSELLPVEEGVVREEGAIQEGEAIPEESDVEEQAFEPVPDISGTEGDVTDESELESPRTQVTDSEYQKSEPALESDVEQPPLESADEEVA